MKYIIDRLMNVFILFGSCLGMQSVVTLVTSVVNIVVPHAQLGICTIYMYGSLIIASLHIIGLCL